MHRVDRDGDGHLVEDATAPAMCGDYGEPGYVPVSIGPDYDCDDSDPNVYAIVYRDADGDGYTAPGETTCGTPDTPGYSSTSRPLDCDDSDPAAWALVNRDADGDGRASQDDTLCATPETAGYRYTVGPWDCDDSDPAKGALGFPDLDQDQFGTLPGVCELGSTALAPYDGDCDDDDASRHPYAIEVADDGIDSDCNGQDTWSSCTLASDVVTIPIDTSCDGVDLVIAAEQLCDHYCGSADYTVRFGNRGTIAAVGLLRVDFTYSRQSADPPYNSYPVTASLELDVNLEPGAVTPAMTFWDGGEISYSMQDATSCSVGYATFSGSPACRP